MASINTALARCATPVASPTVPCMDAPLVQEGNSFWRRVRCIHVSGLLSRLMAVGLDEICRSPPTSPQRAQGRLAPMGLFNTGLTSSSLRLTTSGYACHHLSPIMRYNHSNLHPRKDSAPPAYSTLSAGPTAYGKPKSVAPSGGSVLISASTGADSRGSNPASYSTHEL